MGIEALWVDQDCFQTDEDDQTFDVQDEESCSSETECKLIPRVTLDGEVCRMEFVFGLTGGKDPTN